MNEVQASKAQASGTQTPLTPEFNRAVLARVRALAGKHYPAKLAAIDKQIAASEIEDDDGADFIGTGIITLWSVAAIALLKKRPEAFQEFYQEVQGKVPDVLLTRGGQAAERHQRLLTRLVVFGLAGPYKNAEAT